MNTVRTLVALACVAMPCMAAADIYQLWLEQYDEGRQTTICKYRSGIGDMEVAEYSGRYLCPRVACRIPPPKDRSLAEDCLTAKHAAST